MSFLQEEEAVASFLEEEEEEEEQKEREPIYIWYKRNNQWIKGICI